MNLQAIEESVKRIEKAVSGIPSATRDLKKILRRIGISTRLQEREFDNTSEIAEKILENFESSGDDLRSASSSLEKLLGKVYSNILDYYDAMTSDIGSNLTLSNRFGSGRLSSLMLLRTLKRAPFIGGIIGSVIGALSYIDNLIDQYQALAKRGIRLGDTLFEVERYLQKLGVRFDSLQSILADKALLFLDVGIDRLSEFVKNLRIANKELYTLGLTSEDITRTALSFLEAQRVLGDLDVRYLDERRLNIASRIELFYKTVQFFGGNINNIIEHYTRIAQEPDTFVALRLLPQISRDILAAITNRFPALGEIISQAIIRGGNLARTEAFRKLARAGLTDEVQQIIDMLITGTASPEEIYKAIISLSEEADRVVMRTFVIGDSESAELVAALARIRTMSAEHVMQGGRLTEDLSKELLEFRGVFADFSRILREAVLTSLDNLLQNTELFGQLAESLNSLVKMTNKSLRPENVENNIVKIYEYGKRIEASAEKLSETRLKKIVEVNLEESGPAVKAGFESIYDSPEFSKRSQEGIENFFNKVTDTVDLVPDPVTLVNLGILLTSATIGAQKILELTQKIKSKKVVGKSVKRAAPKVGSRRFLRGRGLGLLGLQIGLDALYLTEKYAEYRSGDITKGEFEKEVGGVAGSWLVGGAAAAIATFLGAPAIAVGGSLAVGGYIGQEIGSSFNYDIIGLDLEEIEQEIRQEEAKLERLKEMEDNSGEVAKKRLEAVEKLKNLYLLRQKRIQVNERIRKDYEEIDIMPFY